MWEYLTVFVLAATPLVELLVVIPLGVAYGLDPVGVAAAAMAGNALPVLGIAFAYGRWERWRQRRREGAPRPAQRAAVSRRRRRAGRLWVSYGTPGLALLAPLLTGVHLATAAALALGAPRHRIAAWMLASVVVWSIAVTMMTIGGIETVRRLF